MTISANQRMYYLNTVFLSYAVGDTRGQMFEVVHILEINCTRCKIWSVVFSQVSQLLVVTFVQEFAYIFKSGENVETFLAETGSDLMF